MQVDDSCFVIIKFLLTTAWTPATAGTPNILGKSKADEMLTSEWAAATAETQTSRTYSRISSITSDKWKPQ
jgi:hypothetical protein